MKRRCRADYREAGDDHLCGAGRPFYFCGHKPERKTENRQPGQEQVHPKHPVSPTSAGISEG